MHREPRRSLGRVPVVQPSASVQRGAAQAKVNLMQQMRTQRLLNRDIITYKCDIALFVSWPYIVTYLTLKM